MGRISYLGRRNGLLHKASWAARRGSVRLLPVTYRNFKNGVLQSRRGLSFVSSITVNNAVSLRSGSIVLLAFKDARQNNGLGVSVPATTMATAIANGGITKAHSAFVVRPIRRGGEGLSGVC